MRLRAGAWVSKTDPALLRPGPLNFRKAMVNDNENLESE